MRAKGQGDGSGLVARGLRLLRGGPARAGQVRLAGRLRGSLWLVPVLCVFGAVGLFFAAIAVDRALERDTAWFLFQGGPEGAREVLSTVASSTMTFTGLVFSVTIVVLQLASRQFSPRVMRTFLEDRRSQVAVGLFIGAFVYALLGLRTVRGASASVEEYVPAFTVWLSVVLAVAAVLVFVAYLHHIAQAIRAVNLLHRIGDEGREALAHLFPEGIGEGADVVDDRRPPGVPALLVAHRGRPGVVEAIDEEGLLSLAEAADVTVALVPRIGDFVGFGTVILEVWGDAAALDADAALDAVVVGRERTTRQDFGFALRELVDIAERALSPGVNDPTTAIQALDQIHDLLRRLATRRFPSPYRLGRDRRLRLLLPRPDWEDHVRLALDEIREAGSSSLQVARRLRFLLDDLRMVAPPSRQAELARQASLLEASDRRGFADARIREVVRLGSPQGHGPPH